MLTFVLGRRKEVNVLWERCSILRIGSGRREVYVAGIATNARTMCQSAHRRFYLLYALFMSNFEKDGCLKQLYS